MKHITKLACLCATALSFAMTTVTPASAQTKIVLNDIGGVTGSKAEVGFKIAASYWESVLTNDVTLHFDVGFSKLGPGILGGTGSSLYTYVPVTDYYAALAATGTSALDAKAVANLAPLSATGGLNVVVPDYFNPATKDGVAAVGSRVAPDDTAISNTIAVSSANWQALGGAAASVDAEMQFSSTFAFDFDPTDGIAAGKYDFIGVAIHEMGHALGFLSGAQDFDYSVGSGFPTDDFWWGYAADIFRYSAPGKLDWTFDTDSYFSIDGGATAFQGDAYFSTGETYGDGWQASHWKAPGTCSDFVGVMNPYTCSGLMDDVTATDLALLDAIGWNTTVNTLNNSGYRFSTSDVFRAYVAAGNSVPEPSSWVMLILGIGAVGGVLRFRVRRNRIHYA